MHNFRQLNIWDRSMDIAYDVINAASDFPNDYRFDITSQIKRSAISVPSNIAEGSARTTNKEFSRFIDIALGSAFELETQLILALRMGLLEKIKQDNFINDLIELQRMIAGFKKTLK